MKFLTQDGFAHDLSAMLRLPLRMCLGLVMLPLSLLLLGYNENNYVCENSRILYAESKAWERKRDMSMNCSSFPKLLEK